MSQYDRMSETLDAFQAEDMGSAEVITEVVGIAMETIIRRLLIQFQERMNNAENNFHSQKEAEKLVVDALIQNLKLVNPWEDGTWDAENWDKWIDDNRKWYDEGSEHVFSLTSSGSILNNLTQ